MNSNNQTETKKYPKWFYIILAVPILPILLLSLWLNDFLNPNPANRLHQIISQLVDIDNQPINVDKPIVIFVGLTRCPDECPTALHDLGNLIATKQQYREKFEFYFMTNDPKHDSTEVMTQYLSNFNNNINPKIRGIIPKPPILKEFGEFFQIPIEPEKHQLVFFYIDAKKNKWLKTPSNAQTMEFLAPPFTPE